MKATIEIPDALYRQLKARAALDGRTVRDVTIELYERWLDEVSRGEGLRAVDRPTAAASWIERWRALDARMGPAPTDGRTIRDVLTADRQR